MAESALSLLARASSGVRTSRRTCCCSWQTAPRVTSKADEAPLAPSSLLGGAVQVLPASLAPSLPLKTSSVGITANECTSRTKQTKCSRGSRRTVRLCEQPRPERSPGGLTGTSPSQLSCPEDSTEPVHAVACSLHSRATMCTS